MRRICIWIPVVLLGAVLAGAVVSIGPRAMLQWLVILVSEDTAYAPGYSEAAFRKIAVGDTEASVRSALGAPLRESAAEPFTSWLYAPDPAPEFEADGSYPDIRFSFTVITFGEDGSFARAFGQISQGSRTNFAGTSASASILGDGENTLTLTNAEIERLKAEKATPEQIEARFGKPQAIFTSRVVRWLRYSHSPGSTHYRLRMVGIDRDGKVAQVRREIYWD